jgi:hypothetical protein
MSRTLALLALALLVIGCTRLSGRGSGPFAGRIKPSVSPHAPVPPGPRPNLSPLALTGAPQPEPPRPPEPPGEGRLVPPRGPAPPTDSRDTRPATPGDDRPLTDSRDTRPADTRPAETGPATPAAATTPESRSPLPRTEPEPAPVQPATASDRPAAPSGVDQAPSGVNHLAEVKKLAQRAAERWAKVQTYEAIVTRRELAPNKEFTEDVVLYQFRKEPMAVYIKTIGEKGRGREILYHPAKHGDKIYAVIGEGDTRLMKPGTRAPAVSPDSPLVKEKTRYSIREAGYGTPIARVLNWVAKVESGQLPADALRYLGPVTRQEFPRPLAAVRLTLRPGDDPLLPRGGTRQWFYDTDPDSTGFGYPVLIIATEPNGQEVEYYRFEKLRFGVPLTDADFSPERLGKK